MFMRQRGPVRFVTDYSTHLTDWASKLSLEQGTLKVNQTNPSLKLTSCETRFSTKAEQTTTRQTAAPQSGFNGSTVHHQDITRWSPDGGLRVRLPWSQLPFNMGGVLLVSHSPGAVLSL